MSKPVIRSPLERMPLHQKQALTAWLTTGGKDGIGITYAAASQRLFAEFGVKAKIGAIQLFYHRQRKLWPAASEVFFDPPSNTITIKIKLCR